MLAPLLFVSLAGAADDAGPALSEPSSAEEAAQRRKVLRRLGIAGVGVGALWYMALGDTLGSGDQASLLSGAGLIAAGGAIVGGGVSLLEDPGIPMDDPASSPAAALRMSMGGTSTLGEKQPYGLSLEGAPRIPIGESGTFIAGVSLRSDLGTSVDVDPRVHGDFEPVLGQHAVGWTAEPEFRYDVSGAWQVRAKLIVRQELSTLEYLADGSSRDMRRGSVIGAVGFQWTLSPRQAFAFYAGPRWDRVAWVDGGEVQGDNRLGPLYGEARYDLHVDHETLDRANAELSGRVRLAYIHDNFHGSGLNGGAIVGFFGPMVLRYDLMVRPNNAGWALSTGVIATIADGGGAAMQIGVQR
ncbi:MAG: hypothetical protein GY913_11410 [Proteobacteria bacterium]|nr:hypothetical protein [Pseudomonadota bacterium]MCP4917522.1 hypothetical protein [Pseudomonadota bacterium]